MQDLLHSLKGQDPGYLRIVARLWGLKLEDQPRSELQHSGLPRLVARMLAPGLAREIIEGLPEEGKQALQALQQAGGSLPWPQFARRYGALREMGPGRRDRERPYLEPNSTTEKLWYRALVGRGFFETPGGLQELAYIPSDLLAQLPPPQAQGSQPLGRPALPAERAYPMRVSDRILDHACTLLAALRNHMPPEQIELLERNWTSSPLPLTRRFLVALLSSANLLDEANLPLPETTRAFLEAPRPQALLQLFQAWRDSTQINELRMLPGLKAEGDWNNDPLRARQAILGFVRAVPPGSWWSLEALTRDVKEIHPDYQRPAGEYDSWYLRAENGTLAGEYLRGFEYWEAVDGALIRYLICGPLHWLGVLELALPEPGAPATAFRHSAWSAALYEELPPPGLPKEDQPLTLGSDARLRVPRLAPRSARYLAARFSAWQGENPHEYLYRITPASLEGARKQGIQVSHVLALLRRHARSVPPSLIKALERWERFGSEARLEQAVVLRLKSPDLLQALRSSPAARFLGDPLGPAAVVVKPGAWEKVLAALAEMGYLGEARNE